MNLIIEKKVYPQNNMEYSFADIDYILSKNDRVNKFYSELKSKFTESGHFSKYDLGPKRNFTTFEDYIEFGMPLTSWFSSTVLNLKIVFP